MVDLFSPNQYGFRAGRSTISATQDLVSSIIQPIEAKSKVTILSLDFRKAFDLIDREILFKKLQRYGVTGVELQWFTSYFSDRYQIVENVFNDGAKKIVFSAYYSDCMRVEYGVPQGAPLGPLLFLLYINDLPDHLPNCKSMIYADDTSIIFQGSTLRDLEDEILNSINLTGKLGG